MFTDFPNDLLARVATTVFPIVSELESDEVWRAALPCTKGVSALSAGENPDGFRHSLIPTMFVGGTSHEAEAHAAFQAAPFVDDQIEEIVSRAAAGALPLPYGSAPEPLALELRAINRVIEVYGLARSPTHSPADAPICPADSHQFMDDACVALEMVAQSLTGRETILSIPFRLALALLDVNNYLSVFALEPLEQGINRPAAEFAQGLDWGHYPYSAIIVPGFGPVDTVRSLSARGRLQAQLAAKYYFQGLAPFIIVSGSKVWPPQTDYRESEELRTALIDRYGIDPRAIVVEPYARHTPSNLRNATRRLAAIGAPLDREALVVTNDDQLNHMLSDMFEGRCMHELGHLPGRFVGRKSDVSAAFLPSLASLTRNPLDPLDP